ncbi:uncharacterized protein LOC133837497 [Drosophila sulfurigaster albostrigata]|uniref:uncharacterized protein LOC133837497 n=1 Tax=Drosophila sulfurigaster albostrigata TaxID=89887 RepID=UPI002D2186DF|nr:uncharacterized protein LOC133837497 [Drosophila sulfurigaster albostrigata]
MCRLLYLLGLLCCAFYSTNGQWLENCDQEPTTLLCRGERAMKNVLRNLSKSEKPLVIMRGLEIVPLNNESTASGNESESQTDASLLDNLASYLRTHEVNLKLSDLLVEEHKAGEITEARKKDKGQGLILAMALMFGKMMAVLGLGGIGALAMKALGVAMVALMLAGMVGLKSAAQQGQESSHTISYVTGEGHHHKRRRRAAGRIQIVSEEPSPYRGWTY